MVRSSFLDDVDEAKTAQLQEDFLAEIASLQELCLHRNIVRIFGTVKGKMAFVSEFCPNGSLAQCLKTRSLDLPARALIAKVCHHFLLLPLTVISCFT